MNNNLLIISNQQNDVNIVSDIIKSNFPDVSFFEVNCINNLYSKIEEYSPDFIILDIDFPELKFREGLLLITEILSFRKLPIIVISETDNYNEIYDAGAINFIQRPFSESTLISNTATAIKLIDNFKSIEQQQDEIDAKDKRIQFQIENELKQRELIIRKNKEIMADIRYASRIQQAILPNLDFISNSIEEYFILHQPKNHVSGDFYWVSNIGDQKIIAVGDCTGHGISGGLMHMLGAVYLNEIVSRNKFRTASGILEQLREHIIKSLNQTGQSGEAQDGLDIALCIIDCTKNELQFSGANNPLYLIRKNELQEIKGDRMPVGIYLTFNNPFTNHVIKLYADDQLYLFSDGYADQFGGPKGKKFRYKQFKELILQHSHEPMIIQKEILNNVHDKWRGSLDQIDDILVFGLKIK
jgi:serine phosphatase RsbU (regulator of sigma subunit)